MPFSSDASSAAKMTTPDSRSRMRLRPVHVWWLGVIVFAPSAFAWLFTVGYSLFNGTLDCRLDWQSTRHVYLPFLAAFVGLCVPLLCLRFLRNVTPRVVTVLFASYVAGMVAWGIADIRNQNFQIAGHEYPNSPLADGHKHHFHSYYTWYFLPYALIEREDTPTNTGL